MESLACLFVCERVRKRLFSDLISLPLHSRSNPTLKIEKAAMKQVHLHQVHLYLFTYSVAYKVWPLRASNRASARQQLGSVAYGDGVARLFVCLRASPETPLFGLDISAIALSVQSYFEN